eukprot:COSAG02_NODE_332_length_24474_cov_23.190949_5_plen_876_part_00
MPRLIDAARAARRFSRATCAITPRPLARRRLALAAAAAGGGALVSCTCGRDSRARCAEGSSGAVDVAAVMAAPMLAVVGTAAYLFGNRSDGGGPNDSSRGSSSAVASQKSRTHQVGSEPMVAEIAARDQLTGEELQGERMAGEQAQHEGLVAETTERDPGAPVHSATSEPEVPMVSEGRANTPEPPEPRPVAQNRKPGAPTKRRRKLRPTMTEADVRALMEEFDVNRDGRIDEDELRAVAFSAGLALENEDVQACIRALDTNGDGYIDEVELAQWLVQEDADGGKRVSNAPYELRARLVAHRCGRALSRQANLVTARLLLGDDADEALAEAALQRAKTRGNGGLLGGTPKSLEESDRIRACLDEVSLLDSLSRAKKERLVQAFRSRHYTAGEQIITQGQVGDAFYILQRGACRVIQHDAVGSDSAASKELRVLRAGAHFGELALKNNTVRSATVEAIENSLILELKAADFQAIIGSLMHVINFTEWVTADKVVAGKSGGGGSSGSPLKLGPKAARGHGDVFNAGSPLEVFRNHKVASYEARLRRLSSPGKVFAYFASVETEDGNQMMMGTDFLAALGVLHPHVVAGQQDEIDEAGKQFTTMIMPRESSTNSNGLLISYAEFRFFRSLLSIRASDLEMAFHLFDRDENGSISRDEFVHMFSALSGESAVDVHAVSVAFFDKLNQQLDAKGGISFAAFSKWLTTLHSELVRLEFLNWATDSSGDGKVDSLSGSDFGRMVVHLVASAGYDVKEHRRRRIGMADKLATARVGLADFAQFSAVLVELEQVEAAIGLSASSATGLVNRTTLERGIDAAFGGQVALPATIIDVIFTVLDGDGDGWLSTDELFGTLRERRRATNGAAVDRGSAYSCFMACVSS